MNGNVLLALLILGYLVAFCVYVVADVNRLCEEQLAEDRHDALLDTLWTDEPPRAMTLEAAQAPEGTGSF